MKLRALILQNAVGEGPGILVDILDQSGWKHEIIHLHLGEAIPSDWQEYALLLVMGGPMNVYEEATYPFLISETRIIAEALKKGVPVLGFCLGSQLMAKASGARVPKGFRKEIGWYPVRLTDCGARDPFLKSFPQEFFAFQWHGDTFELPEGAVRLFSSESYKNQAMRIGSMAYGFQFHFEVTSDMIAEWLRRGHEELEDVGGEVVEKAIREYTGDYLPQAHSLGKSFFSLYLSMIEE